MFCRFCGKQIEEDSLFCKNCGKKVNEEGKINPLQNNISLKDKFVSLPQKYQIGIIVYIIWLLGWICYLISGFSYDNDYYATDYVLPFFLFTIFLPVIGICLIYLYQLWMKKKEKKNSIKSVTSSIIDIDREANNHTPGDSATSDNTHRERTVSLTQFSRNNGKMQIVDKKEEITGKLLERYCIFTSPDGAVTRVEFSESTRNLTANDISIKKNLLCIDRHDNTYTLNYIADNHTF